MSIEEKTIKKRGRIRGVDVGSSANNTYLAARAQGPNVNQEEEIRP